MSRLRRLSEMLQNRGRRWGGIVKLVPRIGWPVVTVSVLESLAIGLLPLGFVFGTSVMIDHIRMAVAIQHGMVRWAPIIPALLFAGGALLLQNVVTPFQLALGEFITQRVDSHCAKRLIHTSLADAPMLQLEDGEVLSLLSDAQYGISQTSTTPGAGVAGLFALIVRYSQMLGAAILVGIVLGPASALILMGAVMVVRVGYRATLTTFFGFWNWQSDARRSMGYMLSTGISAGLGKEMRVLGILGWFKARSRRDSYSHWLPIWRERLRLYLVPFIVYSLILLTGITAVLLQLRGAMLRGGLSVLELSLAIQAICVMVRFAAFFPEADIPTERGIQTFQAIAKLERRFTEAAQAVPAGHLDARGRPRYSICFERVCFAYPGGHAKVLDELHLEFRVGQSTAIVGLNGAGKTTLVKLLSRLYEPDAGRIAVDGIDLAAFDGPSWQRRIAVIFQDYVHYDLDARANVELGAPSRLPDGTAFRRACERAGAAEIIAGLARQDRTPLSSRYSGGVDLSGGQWQRIALARALFAVEAGATVLVLDEPTAQLDARAEVAFFDSFLELTRGLTTIIVSHRSSTVRRADRIVVLEGGRVAEDGTHHELIEAGGRYARLFSLQASRFSKGSSAASGNGETNTAP